MIRYGMAIDLDRCIGCLACVVACKVENGTGPNVFWTFVEDKETGRYPNVSRRLVPRGCMHCGEPPCVEVCPVKATYKRDDGLVLIDEDKCIGCQACVAACPYGARFFVKERKGYYEAGITPYEEWNIKKHRPGVVEKCTFCKDRLIDGREPACVEVCPPNARVFGDLSDPKSEVSQLIRKKHGTQSLQALGYQPAVYYISTGDQRPKASCLDHDGKVRHDGY